MLDKNRIGDSKLPNSLPKSLKRLEVRMNMLESLEFVPGSIEELFADHNAIRKISASVWNSCPSSLPCPCRTIRLWILAS